MDLSDLMTAAFEKRRDLFLRQDLDCFRLLNGEGDGVRGLAADRLGAWILVQGYEEQVLDRNGGTGPDPEYRKAVLKAVKKLPVEIKGVLFKNREKLKGARDFASERKSVLLEGEYPGSDFYVNQDGVLAYADPVNGQSTGIFLDMREVRSELKNLYESRENMTMLNLFSYTCMFSLHGLKHGLSSAVNVDLSSSVLEKAKANYRLNGFRTDDRDFISGDCIEWIKRLGKKGRKFSLIVLDPPTFSRNKKTTFSIRDDYRKILEAIEPLAEEGGYILSAVNTTGISEKEYFAFHPSGWKNIFYKNESRDFPWLTAPYLKTGLWKI